MRTKGAQDKEQEEIARRKSEKREKRTGRGAKPGAHLLPLPFAPGSATLTLRRSPARGRRASRALFLPCCPAVPHRPLTAAASPKPRALLSPNRNCPLPPPPAASQPGTGPGARDVHKSRHAPAVRHTRSTGFPCPEENSQQPRLQRKDMCEEEEEEEAGLGRVPVHSACKLRREKQRVSEFRGCHKGAPEEGRGESRPDLCQGNHMEAEGDPIQQERKGFNCRQGWERLLPESLEGQCCRSLK